MSRRNMMRKRGNRLHLLPIVNRLAETSSVDDDALALQLLEPIVRQRREDMGQLNIGKKAWSLLEQNPRYAGLLPQRRR